MCFIIKKFDDYKKNCIYNSLLCQSNLNMLKFINIPGFLVDFV